MTKKTAITNHVLIPKHSKLSDSERKALLEQYSITIKELPHILSKDPVLTTLSVKPGDIVKIERNSPTAGKIVFYRSVLA